MRLVIKLLTLSFLLAPMAAFGTTKYYLHDAASDVAGYKNADLTQGTSMKTSVTATVSGGTDIQITATNGGSTIRWLTKPLSVALTISGSATCNIWALESNGTANSSIRCRYFKYTGSEGSQIYLAQAPGELTTSATVKSIAATPTSTAFAAGDRIAIYVYLENCSATSGCPTGTMGNAKTVTVDYDGATPAADGDSWLQITENEGIGQSVAAAVTVGLHDAAIVTTPTKTIAAAATLGLSCAVCFIENWDVANATLGLHDAVSVSHVTGNQLITAAETVGVHDAVQCCQTTPFTQPTLGLHDVLAVVQKNPVTVALGQSLGLTPAPLVLVSHGSSITAADTLALSPAVRFPTVFPKAGAVTLGIHIDLQITKNASTGRGMVVVT